MGKFSSVQLLNHVWLFATPWTAARWACLSITNSRSLLKLMSIDAIQPTHPLLPPSPPAFNLSQHQNKWSEVKLLSHVLLFATLWTVAYQAPPSMGFSRSFQMSQFFASGGQTIGVSASVLPLNIWDWFPLGWTGWISLLSKGLSRIFSNTTVQKHQFFSAQFSL